jgi:hypothetical protein
MYIYIDIMSEDLQAESARMKHNDNKLYVVNLFLELNQEMYLI